MNTILFFRRKLRNSRIYAKYSRIEEERERVDFLKKRIRLLELENKNLRQINSIERSHERLKLGFNEALCIVSLIAGVVKSIEQDKDN